MPTPSLPPRTRAANISTWPPSCWPTPEKKGARISTPPEREGSGKAGRAKAKGRQTVRTVTVVNRRGLHARAAAKFVKLAGSFSAEITVANNGNVVSGLSIMGLMMLAAGPGCRLKIRARGADADDAVAALADLIEGKFAED